MDINKTPQRNTGRATLGYLAIAVFASTVLSGCSTISTPAMLSKADPFDTTAQADKAYEQGDWLVAEKYYTDLARMVPNDAYAWNRLGNIRLRQNNFAGAAAAYQESIERDNSSPRAQYNLATAHLLMARHALQTANSLLPKNDAASGLIAKKLSHFDALVYEPMVEVASPSDGLITRRVN